MCRSTSDVHKSQCTVFAFIHCRTGLVISRFLKLRMFECGSCRIYFHGIGFQEPAHQIDVMDRHINEDPPAGRCKFNGSFYQSFRIDSCRFHHIWCTDGPFFDLFLCIRIRRIIAAHEPKEKCQFRMAFHSGLGCPALLYRYSQRLIGKNMLSCIQSGFDLPAVLSARRHYGNCIDICFFQHFTVICIDICNSQLLFCIFQLRRNDRTGCRKFRIRDFKCQVICMQLS